VVGRADPPLEPDGLGVGKVHITQAPARLGSASRWDAIGRQQGSSGVRQSLSLAIPGAVLPATGRWPSSPTAGRTPPEARSASELVYEDVPQMMGV
jgi:hypothetical protein